MEFINLGRVVCTRAIAEAMKEQQFNTAVTKCLNALEAHNYGAIPQCDVEANEADLARGVLENGGGRILARYHTNGTPNTNQEHQESDIYITTQNEGGNIYTCVMFCHEY